MVEIDNDTLYRAVKDAITELMSPQITQQQIDKGYTWIYDAIKEGTKEAMKKSK